MRINNFKLTVTHDPLRPEWLAVDMLRLKPMFLLRLSYAMIVPLKLIHKAIYSARFRSQFE